MKFNMIQTWLLQFLTLRIGMVFGVLIGLGKWDKANAQEEEDNGYPDPIVLLDGVVAARSSIPPGSLKLEHVWQDNVSVQTNIWTVDFEEERRRYHLKAGDKTVLKGVYDGLKVMTCKSNDSEHPEVTFRDIKDQTSNLMFDPRLLGCASVDIWDRDVTSFMLQGNRDRIKSIETKGKVKIDGNDAWHVHVVFDGSYPLDYWIDPERNFRVYQYTYGPPHFERAKSFYENDRYPWIPSKVILERPERGWKILLTLLEAEEKKSFPENHFTIEGMNLPVGTVVNDYSNYKILGYWDGKAISENFVPTARGLNRRTLRFYLILLTVVLAPALGIMVYKQRKQSAQTDTQSN